MNQKGTIVTCPSLKNFAVLVCNGKFDDVKNAHSTQLLHPAALLLLLLLTATTDVRCCHRYISLCPAFFPFFPFFPSLFLSFLFSITSLTMSREDEYDYLFKGNLSSPWHLIIHFIFTILGFSGSYWRLGCRQDQLACPLYSERIQSVRQ